MSCTDNMTEGLGRLSADPGKSEASVLYYWGLPPCMFRNSAWELGVAAHCP